MNGELWAVEVAIGYSEEDASKAIRFDMPQVGAITVEFYEGAEANGITAFLGLIENLNESIAQIMDKLEESQ